MSEFPTTAASLARHGENGVPQRPAAESQVSVAKSHGNGAAAGEPIARFLLVRTGCTDYDRQRRIKGRLDIPLNSDGANQAAQAATDTADVEVSSVYSAPCQASLQTAETIAAPTRSKVKSSVDLQNLDHGLWEGKLIEEVKAQQPKVYRRWREQPETVCPPEGEMLDDARRRLIAMVAKALKKHKTGVIAFVLPEPLATVFSCQMQGKKLGDLWQAEKNSGTWELIEYRANTETREA